MNKWKPRGSCDLHEEEESIFVFNPRELVCLKTKYDLTEKTVGTYRERERERENDYLHITFCVASEIDWLAKAR